MARMQVKRIGFERSQDFESETKGEKFYLKAMDKSEKRLA